MNFKNALIATSVAFACSAVAAGTIIRVSPDGKAPSTVTLPQALEQLKSPKLRNPKGEPLGPITIELSSGTYRLVAPLQIDTVSSGSATYPIIIRGPADRSAIISGGRAVNGFSTVTDPAVLERLPKAARGQVLQANLPQQGITDFGTHLRHGFGNDANNPTALELTQDNLPLTLARWPNTGFATIASTPDGEKGLRVTLQGANMAAWRAEPHLLATGYWSNNWADTTLPIAAVDTDVKQLTLAAPAPPYGIKTGQRFFVQNALAELDTPGEWYLDTATGTLYLWPNTNTALESNAVEASLLAQLLTISKASHITISQVTFQSSRGDAIAIQGGNNIRIENATIRNVGKRGAVVSGQDNGLAHMLIENTGGGGVVLQGGDRQTLTPANLYVEHSTLSRFARVSRTYQPAVLMEGVGNRAVGNTITDSAHTAILFTGNDHLIAENDISTVCLETGDAGVIYTGRDWTARGTVIEQNHLHHIPPNIAWGRTKGVYLDDQASGITVRGNQFDKVDEAVFIGGGRDNLIEDNIFNGGDIPIHLDARGRNWQKAATDDPNGTLRTRLASVPYGASPYKDRYPNLAILVKDELGSPKYNVARRNQVVGDGRIRISKEAESAISVSP